MGSEQVKKVSFPGIDQVQTTKDEDKTKEFEAKKTVDEKLPPEALTPTNSNQPTSANAKPLPLKVEKVKEAVKKAKANIEDILTTTKNKTKPYVMFSIGGLIALTQVAGAIAVYITTQKMSSTNIPQVSM